MQKKLSLMLIVTALSSFVPAYGTRTKSGAKKRKKNKMHVVHTEQRSGDNLITVDPNSGLNVQDNPVIIIPDSEIVTTPVVEDPLNQTDEKNIGIPGLKAVRISALDNRIIMIPDDQTHEIVTTPVVKDPQSTELNQTDKKVIILTGLKAFAARISDGFRSIFS